MLTKKIYTIEEHQDRVNGRLTLTRLAMSRVNQYLKGDKPSPEVLKVFGLAFHDIIPRHLMTKIALEEIRREQVKYKMPDIVPTKDTPEIVFGP